MWSVVIRLSVIICSVSINYFLNKSNIIAYIQFFMEYSNRYIVIMIHHIFVIHFINWLTIGRPKMIIIKKIYDPCTETIAGHFLRFKCVRTGEKWVSSNFSKWSEFKLFKVVPPLFCENLKPLGGGWDSILLVVDSKVFSSLSLSPWR